MNALRRGPSRDSGPSGPPGKTPMCAVRRIMIVEDEPNVRFVFRAALESEAYTLTTAEDGETALRRLTQEAVRPGPAGPPDAGHRWHGGPPASPRGGERCTGCRDHRPRQRGERGGGDEAGGHRLPRQAVDARGAPPGGCRSARAPSRERAGAGLASDDRADPATCSRAPSGH